MEGQLDQLKNACQELTRIAHDTLSTIEKLTIETKKLEARIVAIEQRIEGDDYQRAYLRETEQQGEMKWKKS